MYTHTHTLTHTLTCTHMHIHTYTHSCTQIHIHLTLTYIARHRSDEPLSPFTKALSIHCRMEPSINAFHCLPSVDFPVSGGSLLLRYIALPSSTRLATTVPSSESLVRDRLAGLVVKALASGAEDPGFESRLRQDCSGSSHTSDLKIHTPVATLPGAWHYRVSDGVGRSGVSIL